MKVRILFSTLMVAMLLTGLVAPVAGQGGGGAADRADQPTPQKEVPKEAVGPSVAPTRARVLGYEHQYEWTGAQAIPDSSCPNLTTIPLNVPDTFTINDVRVGFNASHTWRSDVQLWVVSPGGTVVQLLDGTDGGSADNFDVLFEDGGGPVDTVAHDINAPYYEHSWAPIGLLASFIGQDPLGDWVLQVCDDAGGDTGTVNRWALFFNWFETPDLSTSAKFAPSKVAIGGAIDYTVVIQNSAGAPAEEATMVDPVPAGTTYNGDVACSSGQCWYDAGTVYWQGVVGGLPKGAWQPPSAAGGKAARSVDKAANPGMDPAVVPQAPKLTADILLDQQPNQVNGIFSDANCDLCGGAQVLAENVALENTTTVEQIALWGGFYYMDVPGEPDAIRVIIHQDAAGLPGAVVYDESNVNYARAQTGVILFGVHEWLHTLTLGTPAVLPAGNYWVEVYFTTGVGDNSDYFWETGNLDPVRGLTDSAYAFEAPGVTWYYPNGYDMAWQLIGTIGEQPPENPVTVTFSVTPDNPACGDVIANEATINDPLIPWPVVVDATTEMVNTVYYLETFEASDGGYVNAGLNPWTWGPPPAALAPAHSGANVWATESPYVYSADYQLISPWIDLTNADPVRDLVVQWWQMLDVEVGYDFAYLDVTTDGTNWQNVWTGNYHGAWENVSADITGYIGQVIQLRFRLTTDSSVNYNGWAIDDVAIHSGCQLFLYPDIDITPGELVATLCPDQQETQQLTICNWGDLALTWELSELVPPKGVQSVLWDNGPLITHPGGGAGGADASAVQTALGMTVYGFGHQYDLNYWVADDFEVAAPEGWDLESMKFWAYQTNSGPNPTINGVYYKILDGPPGAGGNVVCGDTTTNRLTNTMWPNLYRVLDYDMLNTQRPVMADTVSIAPGCEYLAPGSYWIVWATDGTLTSGPWAPPVTILGQTTTGNAKQSLDGGATWADLVDSGTLTPQGLPFIIEGEIAGPPADLPWLSEDPVAGTVEPQQCQVVNVTFDSTGLLPGPYSGALRVDSNDPDEPQIDVPVNLTVLPCGENSIHVANIDGTFYSDPYGRPLLRMRVRVEDQNYAGMVGAMVDATLVVPNRADPVQRSRPTGPNGNARFHWGSVPAGYWQLCVDNLTLAGYIYDPSQNVETCQEWWN